MRLHIQNPQGDTAFAFTAEQWNAAVERHPDMRGIEVSIASDAAGFERGLAEAEALLTWVDVAKRRFEGGGLRGAAPRLRLIACNSAGVDRLAPFGWLPDDVALLNNRGVHSEKAGEFGLMALLMLQNRMPELIRAQREETWRAIHSTTLAGRTLCVVGVGGLGGGVARRARQFGMRVVGVRAKGGLHPDCDETVAIGELDGVLPRADDLLLACPLTEQTRGLISRRRLGLMRKGSRAVNIARGAVWDQEAVCDALEEGRLESAFTDVTVPEPLPPGHRLWTTRGMIVTPHVAADDRARYNEATLDSLFANLRADRRGLPMPGRVDPAAGY